VESRREDEMRRESFKRGARGEWRKILEADGDNEGGAGTEWTLWSRDR